LNDFKAGDIVSHDEMCKAEGGMLQRGMLFRSPPQIGVILMSQRRNAPYKDVVDGAGNLLYEGHDAPRTDENPEPKRVDQLRISPAGRATENGKFADWTDRHLGGEVPPALFHVYEKLLKGIWSFRGSYALRSYRYEEVESRRVFRFLLEPIFDRSIAARGLAAREDGVMTRRIPTSVKQAVYKRDKGRCVECGATSELHFDHDFPHSKGGTGLTPDNIRILCARHNLSKGSRIQ
jgi:hypothetical protein